MKETHRPLHRNFRSAYCAHYRCSDGSFERSVFFKAMKWSRLLLVPLLGGWRNALFGHDMEAIRSIGEVSTVEAFNREVDELRSVRAMDRHPVRMYLGFRISTQRLEEIFSPLVPMVAPPVAETVAASPKKEMPPRNWTPAADPAVTAGMRGGEGVVYAMRKCLRIHAGVTSGRGLPEMLQNEGISRRELDDMLDRIGSFRGELNWLQSYLRDLERIRSVEEGSKGGPLGTSRPGSMSHGPA